MKNGQLWSPVVVFVDISMTNVLLVKKLGYRIIDLFKYFQYLE